MLSVIIPVMNESSTISGVVSFARSCPLVSEVIVVDDGSIDGSPELARGAGARVITSTLLGKGASMRDGMLAAANDLLVYLDGDLTGLHEDFISRLAAPLISGEADFIKAAFTRDAGRVTILTARPLMQLFFPDLNHIQQPLGGVIALHRSLLERQRFEDDYGVDVGLLLDAFHYRARIVQVEIGHIKYDSHSLDVLGDMATQVMRVILDRAARYGRLRADQIKEVQELERQMHAELPLILQKISHTERLALFDMDGVILDGRFIMELARRTYKISAVMQYLDHPFLSFESRAKFIVSIFQGVPRETFVQIAQEMPLSAGAIETIIALRKRGYRVGIVTDSFFIVSEIVRRRVFADFSIGHLLNFRNDKATGELTLSKAMARHPEGCPDHMQCKLNALRHLTDRAGFDPRHVIAVGDSMNDLCLLQAVSLSFAFQAKNDCVRTAAQFVIEKDLTELLNFIPDQEP